MTDFISLAYGLFTSISGTASLDTILWAAKWWVFISAYLILFTWVFFGHIMRLRQLRDAGLMSWKSGPWRCVFGYISLLVGLLHDVATNVWVGTVVMFEVPKELLLTTRLIRWNRSKDTSWYTRNVRKPFVNFGKEMLDAMDTDGKHIID